MAKKRILYISGSLGLGHITRDLAVAEELRKQNPDVGLSWLAAAPASALLEEAGEHLLPEAELYANENVPAEDAAGAFHLNLLKYLSKAKKEWANNVKAFKRAISKEPFDLVIGDEAYEIAIALMNKLVPIEVPVVMIYDFFGNDSMTKSPLEKLGVYTWNRVWAQIHKFYAEKKNLALFVGELEDIPDKSLGFLLPNRRDYAKAIFEFVGYILPFDQAEYTDKAETRAKLGYGCEPLVVCSIGGTSVGKELLELCGRAYPIIKQEIPDLQMVLGSISTKAMAEIIAKSLKRGIKIWTDLPPLNMLLAATEFQDVNDSYCISNRRL